LAVTLLVADDGPLPLARRRLADAVHALANPQPQWIAGVARWQHSLYTRLRTELAGGRVAGRWRPHSARLPCRGDVLALLVEVDAAVAGWEPAKGDTVDRLHALAARGWRPQDCSTIDDYSSALERWVLAGAELLDPAPVVFLRQPCPRCGAQFAHRRRQRWRAGERAGVAGQRERVHVFGVWGFVAAERVSLAGEAVGLCAAAVCWLTLC
jgi:ribosomal protein S27AE